MLERPVALRSTFSEQPDGLRISIPPHRKIFPAVFLVFWLIIWYLGVKEVGQRVVRDPFANLVETIWLCVWTGGGAWAIAYWLWNLFGRTMLTVRPDTLTLRQSVFALSRTRVFSAQEMSNLRFVSGFSGAGKGRQGNHIAFDYGAKKKWFASEIQEAEANVIIQSIVDRAGIAFSPPSRR